MCSSYEARRAPNIASQQPRITVLLFPFPSFLFPFYRRLDGSLKRFVENVPARRT